MGQTAAICWGNAGLKPIIRSLSNRTLNISDKVHFLKLDKSSGDVSETIKNMSTQNVFAEIEKSARFDNNRIISFMQLVIEGKTNSKFDSKIVIGHSHDTSPSETAQHWKQPKSITIKYKDSSKGTIYSKEIVSKKLIQNSKIPGMSDIFPHAVFKIALSTNGEIFDSVDQILAESYKPPLELQKLPDLVRDEVVKFYKNQIGRDIEKVSYELVMELWNTPRQNIIEDEHSLPIYMFKGGLCPIASKELREIAEEYLVSLELFI